MRAELLVTDLVMGARNGDKQAWDALAMLADDPAVPDAEIGARLGLPAGSAGPDRSRCLEQLRSYPAVAALISAGRPAL